MYHAVITHVIIPVICIRIYNIDITITLILTIYSYSRLQYNIVYNVV